MLTISKEICRFNGMLIKMPMAFFFGRNRTKILIFLWNLKGPLNSHNNLGGREEGNFEKKSRSLRFQNVLWRTVIKTVWYWHKDQWVQTRNKPLYIWPNDYQQECQDYAVGKRESLLNKWCWENWVSRKE